jgi:hypothetical protein
VKRRITKYSLKEYFNSEFTSDNVLSQKNAIKYEFGFVLHSPEGKTQMDFADSVSLSPTLVLNYIYYLNKIVNCSFTFKYAEEDIM